MRGHQEHGVPAAPDQGPQGYAGLQPAQQLQNGHGTQHTVEIEHRSKGPQLKGVEIQVRTQQRQAQIHRQQDRQHRQPSQPLRLPPPVKQIPAQHEPKAADALGQNNKQIAHHLHPQAIRPGNIHSLIEIADDAQDSRRQDTHQYALGGRPALRPHRRKQQLGDQQRRQKPQGGNTPQRHRQDHVPLQGRQSAAAVYGEKSQVRQNRQSRKHAIGDHQGIPAFFITCAQESLWPRSP